MFAFKDEVIPPCQLSLGVTPFLPTLSIVPGDNETVTLWSHKEQTDSDRLSIFSYLVSHIQSTSWSVLAMQKALKWIKTDSQRERNTDLKHCVVLMKGNNEGQSNHKPSP